MFDLFLLSRALKGSETARAAPFHLLLVFHIAANGGVSTNFEAGSPVTFRVCEAQRWARCWEDGFKQAEVLRGGHISVTAGI